MGFAIHPLFSDETFESAASAVLVLLALKSFEYVVKTLMLSSGSSRLNTAKFALANAIDQAYNPLNYFRWVRGTPDTPLPISTDITPAVAHGVSQRKRITLSRATLAISLAVLTLLAEAVFFYAVLPAKRDLTLGQLQLAVEQVDTPFDNRELRPDSCTPVEVPSLGRASLTAVFAFCNRQSSNGTGSVYSQSSPVFVSGSSIRQRIVKTFYSLRVSMEDTDFGNTVQSETSFTLLLPGKSDVNMVVRIFGNTQAKVSNAITAYFKEKGCTIPPNSRADNVTLTNCKGELRPSEILQFHLTHIAIVQNRAAGEIGYPNGDAMMKAPQDKKIGYISLLRITAGGLLGTSLAMLFLAILCNAFRSDDSNAVIAAMIRINTKQSARTPLVALDESTLKVSNEYDSQLGTWKEEVNVDTMVWGQK